MSLLTCHKCEQSPCHCVRPRAHESLPAFDWDGCPTSRDLEDDEQAERLAREERKAPSEPWGCLGDVLAPFVAIAAWWGRVDPRAKLAIAALILAPVLFHSALGWATFANDLRAEEALHAK